MSTPKPYLGVLFACRLCSDHIVNGGKITGGTKEECEDLDVYTHFQWQPGEKEPTALFTIINSMFEFGVSPCEHIHKALLQANYELFYQKEKL